MSETPKTHDCQGCLSRRWRGLNLDCTKGHKPRFYKPKSPLDTGWGWKRRCDDFEPRPETTPAE